MLCLNRLVVSTAIVLAIATPPLAAADLQLCDLRIGFGALAKEYHGASTTTVTDDGGHIITTGSDSDGRNADDNWRGQVQFVAGSLGSAGGLVYGAGVAMNNATWHDGGQDVHLSTPVVDVLVGYGYAVTPYWHVEATPFAGYGRGYFSVTDGGSTHTSHDWVDYLEYGAKVGTYVALEQSLVLGVEVPYLVGRLNPDFSHSDHGDRRMTFSDERRNQGFGLLVTIGGRF